MTVDERVARLREQYGPTIAPGKPGNQYPRHLLPSIEQTPGQGDDGKPWRRYQERPERAETAEQAAKRIEADKAREAGKAERRRIQAAIREKASRERQAADRARKEEQANAGRDDL